MNINGKITLFLLVTVSGLIYASQGPDHIELKNRFEKIFNDGDTDQKQYS